MDNNMELKVILQFKTIKFYDYEKIYSYVQKSR